ncbi:uncharacterized protein [Spinacia oleracea]|uniref:Uncharacterized protein isoform X2 n=1 Tax=Spinacia oleracea TaxID=3562 RepID=A0ABM3R1B3_SPIOL|nr:uncharacterized protein LOC130464043 isoform X2 [Spinacia oleracea]
MIQENEIESPFSHKVAYECENTSTSANEQGLEIEPQLRHDENVVMDGRSEALSEKGFLAITTEIPKEAPTMKKRRGPTKLVKVHARTMDERPYLILNKFGQPVGPTDEIVEEFTRFLGTLAKDSELAPLNFVNWPSLPTHDKIWDYVQETYLVPEEGRKWVMETVNYAWRIHKCKMKQKYYYAFDTDEERLEKPPETMPKTHFEDLLNYWNLTTTKEESETNKRNRQMLEDMHTMGPKSYALLRHKFASIFRQEDPNKQEPSQAKVYKASRSRNPKKTYKTSFKKTKDNIE